MSERASRGRCNRAPSYPPGSFSSRFTSHSKALMVAGLA